MTTDQVQPSLVDEMSEIGFVLVSCGDGVQFVFTECQSENSPVFSKVADLYRWTAGLFDSCSA